MACNSGCCKAKQPPATGAAPNAPVAPSVTDQGQSEKSNPPPCCESKPSPCCDVTCLDRLALRACEDKSRSAGLRDASSASSCTETEDGKPCNYHSRKTRDAYEATLEALGCICRALLALGEESCCLPKERSSVDRRRDLKHHPSRRLQPAATPGPSASSSSKRQQDPPRKPCSKGCCGDKTAPGEDKPALATLEKTCCKSGSTGRLSPPRHPCSKGFCGDKTASGEDKPAPATVEKKCCTPGASTGHLSNDHDIASADVEKGLVGREHVILSVSGMTCTGCETKLQRVLSTLPPVKNLKTSLVLARAEFDLDLGSGSLPEVLKHLERTTEFKCERMGEHASTVDILVDDAVDFVKREWPKGVTDVVAVDKQTVRVAYDPELAGARDLLEGGWGAPLELAPLGPDPTLAAGNKHLRHMGYMTLLSIVLTIPVLVLAWASLPEHEIAYSSASLALATVLQVVVAGPFYPKALKALVFSRVIEMDLLIVLSTSAAYVFSVVSFGHLVSGDPLSTGSFFETSTLLVTLIMVGRFVAALARQKAVESISIHSLQPASALLVDKAGGGDREIDARLLQYGDIFRLVPESRIATDGTVIDGSSEVDESMITGESRPVEKHVGSALIAGTVNGSGTLTARVTRLPGTNTIDMIAGMVDQAKLSKPKLQHIADRVASHFVPVVVGLVVVTFVAWIGVGVAGRGQSAAEATIQAITYAITVLIVSCPCAIGLAVPMVVVIATGVAAEHGVIFKSAESIEIAYRATHVVLDKTGTLTEGKLSVVAEEYHVEGDGASDSASMLLGLVDNIKHPVAVAVSAHLKAKGASAVKVNGVKALPGKGVTGTTASGLELRAGNSRWLGLSSDPRLELLLSNGHTVFCLTVNDTLTAVFGLHDSLREDAPTTIQALHSRNIAVHVLSGDDDGAVRRVTDHLDIPPARVRSRCTPADKQSYIQDLLSTSPTGSRSRANPPVVIFCGDGTNDAPALAAATIGIAMMSSPSNPNSNLSPSAAGEVSKSAADIVLMRPDLGRISTVMALSRKAVRRIMFNFAWSFVYNLLAVLLASGALVHVRIPPQFAGLGELVSVLPVVVAGLLLRWDRI
ncbi:putative copper-transporting ATPase [Parathielavia hyrcaniae]|uniref:Copper-transporting ATPase n=1 Tax=Parathielavia hyrcaniae TaxID=113614 RepID=A0AAN6SYL5_9PEZI|nr:putative copper-transporting ATPase [Parathielavia hyrcaniae]